MHQHNLLVSTLVTALIMGIVTIGFFAHHLHLVATNVTTNEQTKWLNLRKFVPEPNIN